MSPNFYRCLVGIFPGFGFFKAKSILGRKCIGNLDIVKGADVSADSIFENLDLSVLKGKVKSVDLILGDAFSDFTLLPWQESLSSPIEIKSFAEHQLEQVSIRELNKRFIHAEYVKFGCAGFAYAYDHDLINKLQDKFNQYGIELKSIQPFSASGILNFSCSSKVVTLLLLEDSSRASALLYHEGKITAYIQELKFSNSSVSVVDRVFRFFNVHGYCIEEIYVACAMPGESSYSADVLDKMPCKVKVVSDERWLGW